MSDQSALNNSGYVQAPIYVAEAALDAKTHLIIDCGACDAVLHKKRRGHRCVQSVGNSG